MSNNMVEEATERWREVLKAYHALRLAHGNFCKAAETLNPDLAGPGLRIAIQLLFHRRNFQMFMEDLLYEHHRHGDLARVTPPDSSGDKLRKKDWKDQLKSS